MTDLYAIYVPLNPSHHKKSKIPAEAVDSSLQNGQRRWIACLFPLLPRSATLRCLWVTEPLRLLSETVSFSQTHFTLTITCIVLAFLRNPRDLSVKHSYAVKVHNVHIIHGFIDKFGSSYIRVLCFGHRGRSASNPGR